MTEFLITDVESKNAKNVDCSTTDPAERESCKVDLLAFAPCTAQNDFGFKEGKPCVFLKLNKIYEWKPNYYKKVDELPNNMPESLKRHIKDRATKGETLEVVWVSCEGEKPGDVKNLPLATYRSLNGEQGFLGRYFPYKNTESYLQPIVAVQFSIARELMLR